MPLVLAMLFAPLIFLPLPHVCVTEEETITGEPPLSELRPLKNLPYPIRPNRITQGFRHDRRSSAVRGKVAVRQ